MSTKRRRLTNVVVKRIDLVDAGDNPAADVLIYKAKGGGMITCPSCGAKAPKGTEACPECGKPMAAPLKKYNAEPRTVGQVLQARETQDELWNLQSAFGQSLDSIMASDLEPAGRVAAIQTSLEEYLAALKVLIAAYAAAPDVTAPEIMTAETVSDMAKRAAEEVSRITKEASMSKQDPKAPPAFELAQIPEALRPAVEAFQKRAGEADKAAEDLKTAAARVTALEGEVAELKKKLEPIAPPVENPEVVELRKKVADMEDRESTRDFEKRARDLGPTLVGTTAEKLAPVLKRIHGGKSTKEDGLEVERLLKSAFELASQSTAFKKLGQDGGPVDDALAVGDAAYEIAKRRAADLISKGEAKTEPEALDLVWKRDKGLWARYRQTAS